MMSITHGDLMIKSYKMRRIDHIINFDMAYLVLHDLKKNILI